MGLIKSVEGFKGKQTESLGEEGILPVGSLQIEAALSAPPWVSLWLLMQNLTCQPPQLQ